MDSKELKVLKLNLALCAKGLGNSFVEREIVNILDSLYLEELRYNLKEYSKLYSLSNTTIEEDKLSDIAISMVECKNEIFDILDMTHGDVTYYKSLFTKAGYDTLTSWVDVYKEER